MTNETLNVPRVNPVTGESLKTTSQINPQYCLTPSSAQELLAILKAGYPQYTITMSMSDPEVFDPGSPDTFNLKVPWIDIQDGQGREYQLNAGQFAAYWASAKQVIEGQPSNDPGVAWRDAQQDIVTGLQYIGGQS